MTVELNKENFDNLVLLYKIGEIEKFKAVFNEIALALDTYLAVLEKYRNLIGSRKSNIEDAIATASVLGGKFTNILILLPNGKSGSLDHLVNCLPKFVEIFFLEIKDLDAFLQEYKIN